MRELLATGWMSNRGRQNVASYLVFDLQQDWRFGAAHFEALLLDYDVCSNWGNWVSAAGLTGGRINKFNIPKQSKDYDANVLFSAPLPSGGLGRPSKCSPVAVDFNQRGIQSKGLSV